MIGRLESDLRFYFPFRLRNPGSGRGIQFSTVYSGGNRSAYRDYHHSLPSVNIKYELLI